MQMKKPLLVRSDRQILTAGIDRSVMHVHNPTPYNLQCSRYVYVHIYLCKYTQICTLLLCSFLPLKKGIILLY